VATNSTTRFSDRVDNYIKYRPGYPSEIIDYLKSESILKNDSIIADIGSGTGISAELFLKNGNTVYCIEPNKEMREAAEKLLKDYPNFISVNGTAENAPVPGKYFDLIVCAQSFHWFDIEKVKNKFKHLLVESGSVCLIWNERKINSTPFLSAYEELLNKFGTDYKSVRHEIIDDKKLTEFFDKGYKSKTFPNGQVFDFEGLKGRLLSSSYAPNEHNPHFEPMIEELKDIFERHQHNGNVRFEYDTNVYSGSLFRN
jgi:ubiquinone/menaquinone biosynthesis C-methylase UbiE